MESPAELPVMRFVAFLAAFVALAAPAPAADGPLSLAEAAAMPYVPVVKVVDTVSSLGPLAAEPQVVTLADLVRTTATPATGCWWLPPGSRTA